MPSIRPIILPNSPILFVGEAPGAEEEKSGLPFVGRSGQEFNLMLAEAEISRGACSITNVFLERPPDNNLSAWAVKRVGVKGLLGGKAGLVGASLMVIAVPGGIIDPSRAQAALARLTVEIAQTQSNIIVALGNTALQALCALNGIGALRGTLQFERLTSRHTKVLPTYHPAGVMRKYEWRPSVIADLMKAKIESAFPEPRFYDRKIYIEPTVQDLFEWKERLLKAESITFDIETKNRQITMIGLAPNKLEVFVIPFWVDGGSYWTRLEDEVLALKILHEIMTSPIPKIAQNGLYDVQYLSKYCIPVTNFQHDTMILSHSLYPALPKSLAFLGSLHCTERSWKKWRLRKGDSEELKRES